MTNPSPRRTPARHAALLCLVALLAACAGAPAATRQAPASNSRFISQEEVERSQARDVYELVQLHRPGWLRQRGTYSFTSDGAIQVYVNDQRVGGVNVLRGYDVAIVRSARFLDPVEASGRYGLNHNHGAIQLYTRVGS